MKIELFEHNETAFQKLKKFLENNILASVDHATGTGKSFIALKYLYENKDKRILYLTPTYAIYDQLIDVHMKKLGIGKKEFNKFDNVIYPNLLKLDMAQVAKNYDIIVFDEYHRCGAKKWGKKIKELKQYIIDNYPDKRIIGLTATNIRYLDKERNMNAELFDGNCVSNLTLDDALLKGLLPAPTYVNTYTSCEVEINKLRRKIFTNIPYKEDRLEYLKKIDNIKESNDYQALNEGEYDLPRENGKYIVFCSTIKDIKKNMDFIENKFPNKKLKFFEVHSGRSKDKNAQELKKFRENEGSNAFIFVVDILNEGVHVDDIDGIFMMRKTTSPIIFFQQLGRLLSFSGKNRKLMVWDLVDNLRNHPVIYKLVDTVNKLAKERLQSDPENRDRYLRILENFKIIDHTASTLAKINELNNELDNLDFNKIRIDRIVKILGDPNYKDKSEWLSAYSDLFKYYKYMNLEHFRIIKPLSIYKPKEIDCSEKEFLERLDGFGTLKEKETYNLEIIILEFEEFINNNNRVPSVLSSDKDERELAVKITEIVFLMSDDQLNRYNIAYKKIKRVSAFDRAFYGKNVSEIQLKEVLSGCKVCYDNGYYVNRFLKNFIKKAAKDHGSLGFGQYVEDLELSPFVDSLKINSRILSKIEEEKRKITKKDLEQAHEEPVEDLEGLRDCYLELKDFISENLRYPNNQDGKIYYSYVKFRKLLIKYNYKIKLDSLLKLVKAEFAQVRRSDIFNDVVKFIENNNGDFPTDRSDDELEQKLAKNLKKEFSKFTEEEKKYLKNLRSELQADDNLIKIYLEFIITNKRFPIKTVSTYEEDYLHLRFLRNEPYLTVEQTKLIKDTKKKLNEKTLIRNTYLERLKLTEIYERKQFINRIITFLESTYGDMPKENSMDENEKALALEIKAKKSSLNDEELSIIAEIQNGLKAQYNFNVVEEYINFIVTNQKYPLASSEDELEKAIAIIYERNYNLLSKEDLTKITEVIENIGKNVLYENTYINNTRK